MATYESGAGRSMDDMAEDLGDILKLDVDAVQAYNEAIEKIENQSVRAQLSTYRDDHQRHVTDLTQAIRTLGKEPPSATQDIKGKLIEGMTSLRSSLGDDQALKAMRQNEQITNNTYEDAASKSWTADVAPIIERGLADERRHLAWIEQQLSVGVGSSASSPTF